MRFCVIKGLAIFALLVSCSMQLSAQGGFALEYDGLALEKTEQVGAISHPLLLSAPKRVSNNLRIDKQVQVQGTKYSYLYRVKPGYDVAQAADFYLEILSASGEVEFQCDKRNCGASNDWANKIFGLSILAGRDSNQQYFAGTFTRAGLSGWLSVYAVTNGRREPYLYITYIPVSDKNVLQAVRSGVLITEGRIQSDKISPLKRHLAETAGSRLVLVSFSQQPNVDFQTNVGQAKKQADKVAGRLAEKLVVDVSRIEIKALGPLGQKPLGHDSDQWIYLYLAE